MIVLSSLLLLGYHVSVVWMLNWTEYETNGRIVDVGEYPYLVSIRYIASKKHMCAGLIIDPMFVVTSCHCVKRFSQGKIFHVSLTSIEIVAGDIHSYIQGELGQTRPIEMVIMHDKCDFKKKKDLVNVAVMKLSFPFLVNKSVMPFKFYRHDNSTKRKHQTGTGCSTLQWGFMRKQFPQYPFKVTRFLIILPTHFLSPSECKERICDLPKVKLETCEFVQNQYEVCYLSLNSSKYETGESGGFLFCDGYLEGMKVCLSPSCQVKGTPFYYTHSKHFVDFLTRFASRGSSIQTQLLFLYIFCALVRIF